MQTLEDDFRLIYEAIQGDHRLLPWVRNAWKDGTGFAEGYDILWQQREILAQRLGIEDFCEDENMEAMMNAVLMIQEDLCRRMFYCTIRYVLKGCKL